MSFLVVDAGVGLNPRDIPNKYRTGVHICFPPSRRPCWCGGWHAPDDPADLVIIAGPDAARSRFAEDRPGVAILPSGHLPHPDLSTLFTSPNGIALTTVRIIEHTAEGLLVPGVIGYALDDLCAIIGRSRRLGFSYAASANGIVRATELMLAGASGRLSQATDLLFRQTGDGNMLLADISDNCDRVCAQSTREPNLILYATINRGSSPFVASALGAC